jgi:hypothetical protein
MSFFRKSPSGSLESFVSRVFGRSGTVTAEDGDYLASQVFNDSAVTGSSVREALNNLESQSGVSSVFGRSGNVIAQFNDYSSSQIANDSGIAGVTVSDALNQLNNRVFGTELETRYLASQSSNVAGYVPATGLSIDLTGAPAGTYRFSWSAIVERIIGAGSYQIRLYDGTATLWEILCNASDPLNLSPFIDLSQEAKTYTIEFGPVGAGSTIQISRATFSAMRIL